MTAQRELSSQKGLSDLALSGSGSSYCYAMGAASFTGKAMLMEGGIHKHSTGEIRFFVIRQRS